MGAKSCGGLKTDRKKIMLDQKFNWYPLKFLHCALFFKKIIKQHLCFNIHIWVQLIFINGAGGSPGAAWVHFWRLLWNITTYFALRTWNWFEKDCCFSGPCYSQQVSPSACPLSSLMWHHLLTEHTGTLCGLPVTKMIDGPMSRYPFLWLA